MNGLSRDDISRIIYDNGLFHGRVCIGVVMDLNHLERFAAIAAAAERAKVARWMMTACYATGHGDTTEDLLRELAWQADERIAKAVAAEREACAKICEKYYTYHGYQYMADDIRARGSDAA